MDYKNKYLKYKEKYMKMKGGNETIINNEIIININALRDAWELYERYVMLKLCVNKVNIDDELWLPVEIWDIIVNMMKNDIESMNIYDSNPFYEQLTLKLLNKYKKEKLSDNIEQDSNISLCITL
ncbi:hypothetical protein Klosneuvirus_1_174 [Klosneuvirus KNV1]|uniref:Uncharacterized protein n=1 Tax=Klosneuvirus KNV1 TaxID=1977640 RepID=A0A1V0SHX8_9VIRU|nr:hypothetical protein Klosneuvirus_1_174 [Klosneuvirus KNV1]